MGLIKEVVSDKGRLIWDSLYYTFVTNKSGLKLVYLTEVLLYIVRGNDFPFQKMCDSTSGSCSKMHNS